MVSKQKITLKKMIAYLQGNYRYKLWYSRFRFLIRSHIQEQIKMRVLYMNPNCYNNGVCEKCGCVTLALQMANKACDGLCYPRMMDSREWHNFVMEGTYLTHKGFNDKGFTWLYRKDYLSRYNHKTLQNDTLLPKKQQICG